MKKFIKYNTSIFLAWFVYIVLGKKVNKEAFELLNNHFKATPRQKRLLDRIEKKNS